MGADEVQQAATTGKAVAPRFYEKLGQYLQQRAQVDKIDGSELAADAIDRVFTATTAEEMWDADEQSTLNGQDLVGVFQRINGYRVAESTRDDIAKSVLGVFVFVDATNLQTGENMTWNTGATGIISKLRWLESQDMLGTEAADCFIKSVPTPGGAMLKLRPMPKTALKSSATSA